MEKSHDTSPESGLASPGGDSSVDDGEHVHGDSTNDTNSRVTRRSLASHEVDTRGNDAQETQHSHDKVRVDGGPIERKLLVVKEGPDGFRHGDRLGGQLVDGHGRPDDAQDLGCNSGKGQHREGLADKGGTLLLVGRSGWEGRDESGAHNSTGQHRGWQQEVAKELGGFVSVLSERRHAEGVVVGWGCCCW